MHTYQLLETSLDIDIRGLDQLWALRTSLSLPRAHVRDVRRRVESDRPPLWRVGTYVPGVIVAGSYYGRSGGKLRREFWATHLGEHAVVVELDGGPYDKVVVDLADAGPLLAAFGRG